MKKCILALCILVLFLVGCGGEQPASDTPPAAPVENLQPPPAELPPWPPPEDTRSFEERTADTIQATITMENGGVIVMELYPELAPQSVRNFVELARKGFYDGLAFHRIMSGFMVQGGCPDGTGSGNPGYSIRGEYEENGFKNELNHLRGVVSMARGGNPNYDSAGSQFFIVHANSPGLNKQYAGFGKVISGMEVVDEIAETPNSGPNGAVAIEDRPIIKTITIDSDVELPPPDKISR